MNNIQVLIDWAKDQEEKALADYKIYNDDGDTPRWAGKAEGKAKAFSDIIQKMKNELKDGTTADISITDEVSTSSQTIAKPLVMRSCIHCGNKKSFEVWIELEYNDGSGEPNTCNHLVDVEFVKCLKCGEVF